jgi:hypothetical protein
MSSQGILRCLFHHENRLETTHILKTRLSVTILFMLRMTNTTTEGSNPMYFLAAFSIRITSP